MIFPRTAQTRAFACQEKLDLRTLDHLTWCAVQMANSIWKTGVDFVLSTGERLKGKVHCGWNESDIGGLLTRSPLAQATTAQGRMVQESRKEVTGFDLLFLSHAVV